MLTVYSEATSRGDQYHYYFDFHSQQLCVVRFRAEDIEKTNTKYFVGVGFTGAAYTFITTSFDNVYINLHSFHSILFFALLIFIFFCISKKYDANLKKRGNFERADADKLSELFKVASKARVAQMVFLFFCFFGLLIAWIFSPSVIEFFSFFLYVLAVVAFLCFSFGFTPFQIIKFKLYLRRCKKECQKK